MKPKTCGCGRSFEPSNGHQKLCEQCRLTADRPPARRLPGGAPRPVAWRVVDGVLTDAEQ